MVLEVISRLVSDKLSSRYVPYVVAGAGAVVTRSWTKGFVCTAERNITNKTWIIIGAFSGPGLVLLRQLAVRGSQVIALHPDPSSPAIHQLVVLLRESTGNERIYADECDVLSIKSIRKFVKRWEKDGRVGMVGDLEARVEGIIFCDGDGSGLEGTGMGIGKVTSTINEDESMELNHLGRIVSRHAFIQLFLPTLSKSSIESPVRIISQISPAYAASPPLLPPFTPSELNLDYESKAPPKWEPWVAEGKASLLSIALLRELQERMDDSTLKAKKKGQGIICVSVSGGYTRSWFRRNLRAEFDHPKFAWFGFILYLALFPFILLLGKSAEEAAQTLLMAVLAGVEKVEVPTVAPEEVATPSVSNVEPKETTPTAKAKDDEPEVSIRLRGGAVYAEGKAIRIMRLEDAGPTLGPALWTIESKRVERLVAKALAEEKAEETK